MKRLSILFLWAFSVSAQTWSTLNVDLVMHMNTSTPGTTLTTTIANAGTSSNTCVVGGGGSTGCNYSSIASGLTVGQNQNACSNLGPVQLNNGGTLYATQALDYSNVAHADTSFGSISEFTFNSAIGNNVTVMGCFTLGMAQQLNGNDYDLIWIEDGSGRGSIAQLGMSACGSHIMGLVIEENTPFAHSACIQIIPQQTYFISLNHNSTSGKAFLTVYTAQGAEIGQVNCGAGDATCTSVTAGSITDFRLSSNENGTDAGTTYYQNFMASWTSPPTSLFWTQTDTWAGVLAPSRGASWAAGVQGGIPTTRTQCGSTVAAGSSASTINTAISSCGSNQFVLLASGTFSSLGNINISKSNVTLRGLGADQTQLQFTGGAGVNLGTNNSNTEASPVLVTPMGCANQSIYGASCTAGGGAVVQGANTVSLASVSGLVVGNPMILDQHDSGTDAGGILVLITDNSYTGSFTSPGSAGPYSGKGDGGQNMRCPGGNNTPSNCDSQQQQVMVTSCNGVTTVGTSCTGTNVTVGFSPALYLPNWSTASSMSAWWYTAPISYSGVEDLTLDSSSNTGSWDNMVINNCVNCWEKGVRSINGAGDIAHTIVQYSPHASIVNNYFFLTQNYSTSSYGVDCFGTSDLLVENNIFHAVASPIIDNSTCVGMVDDYNFGANMFYNNNGAPYNQNFRGGHSVNLNELGEGNISNTVDADVIHATSDWNTYNRNVFIGPQPQCYNTSSNTSTSALAYSTATYAQCTNFDQAVEDSAYHRFYNFIGNILGTAGYHTTYQNGNNDTSIYQIGVGNSGFSPAVPSDSVVLASAALWGNADAVTGFSSPRFNCNELMSGTAFSSLPTSQIYAFQPCPSSNTLPASFFYSSKPSWWPSAKPWPPIGPDVTGGNLLVCGSGAQIRSLVTSSGQCPSGSTSTFASGHANSIPAMDCYLTTMSGPANGVTTSVLTFSEASCYSAVSNNPQPASSPAVISIINGGKL